MIQFQNVTVTHQAKNSLQDATFVIQPGEFVYLLGPSGAGKSTILKLIYMDLFPTSGEVRVGEFTSQSVRKNEIPYLRRQLGIVFQDFRLLRDRNVYDNIAFTLMVIDTPKNDVPKKVMRVLAEVGLSNMKNRMPHELSGGEQQRVVIARALVNTPMVILADEPTGNLDPDTSMEIMELLNKIQTGGTGIIMATHDYEIVKKVPQRLIKLEKGRVVSDSAHV
jgi:cell division transport system ATP-binding protein